jgi:hypothetical protein
LYKPVRTGRCPGLPVAAIKPLIPWTMKSNAAQF